MLAVLATILDKSPWDSNPVLIYYIFFEIFLQFSLPLPYTKLKLRKKFWTHFQRGLWGEGRGGPVCIGKRPKKCKEVPRLLSMFAIMDKSLIPGLPHKTAHPPPPPPPTLYKVETRKKFWIHASNFVCGVGGRGYACVNWKMLQKCKCPNTSVHDCRLKNSRCTIHPKGLSL